MCFVFQHCSFSAFKNNRKLKRHLEALHADPLFRHRGDERAGLQIR